MWCGRWRLNRPDSGREAIVRTLLKAMEYPQGPVEPARPQKIVVSNRETQFFLRGALQDLDIKVDYAPTLPLIEEICEGLQAMLKPEPPPIPADQAQQLISTAYQIWHDAPWELLGDHHIISINLNYRGIDTLYVSVLGLLGMEYGLLLYRSQDSLRQFRQQVLVQDASPEDMEAVFLQQDCLFINFDSVEEEFEPDAETPLMAPVDMATMTGVTPVFGSIHPLEGLRPFLDDEEAIVLTVTLEALHRFFSTACPKICTGSVPSCEWPIPDSGPL